MGETGYALYAPVPMLTASMKSRSVGMSSVVPLVHVCKISGSFESNHTYVHVRRRAQVLVCAFLSLDPPIASDVDLGFFRRVALD